MNISNQNLIFLHLPKTAGSTLHSFLQRHYPKESTFTIRVINNTELNTNNFLELSYEEKQKIKLLKGHMNFGLHSNMPNPSKYITFIRKPEDRIISFYYYVLNSKNHRLKASLSKKNITLKEFVTELNDKDLNNGQIRYISGIDDTEEKMLEKALDNIENHFSFVGLQEKFDESLLLLSNIYHWGIPFYKSLNKTKNRVQLNEVDIETKNLIHELNKGDNMLYETIEKKINSQLTEIDNLPIKLLQIKLYSKIFTISKNIKKRFYNIKHKKA